MTTQAILRMALRRTAASTSRTLCGTTGGSASAASAVVSRTARSALLGSGAAVAYCDAARGVPPRRFKSSAAAAVDDYDDDDSAAGAQPLHSNETFLNGTGSLYAEQMYDAWLADPASVHETWRAYFENLERGVPYDEADYSSPSVVPGTGVAAASASSLAGAGAEKRAVAMQPQKPHAPCTAKASSGSSMRARTTSFDAP